MSSTHNTTLFLKEPLKMRLKVYALKERTSMAEILNLAAEEWLQKHSDKEVDQAIQYLR